MKHQDILDMMTVEEKAALLSGASEWTSRGCERLGIPEITFFGRASWTAETGRSGRSSGTECVIACDLLSYGGDGG